MIPPGFPTPTPGTAVAIPVNRDPRRDKLKMLVSLWLPDSGSTGYATPVLACEIATLSNATCAADVGRAIYGAEYPEWVHADTVNTINLGYELHVALREAAKGGS